jgi:hypothetical protein
VRPSLLRKRGRTPVRLRGALPQNRCGLRCGLSRLRRRTERMQTQRRSSVGDLFADKDGVPWSPSCFRGFARRRSAIDQKARCTRAFMPEVQSASRGSRLSALRSNEASHTNDSSEPSSRFLKSWLTTVSSHLTDGRGMSLALRRTSIWSPHDRALSRSKTAMLPGCSPARPTLRKGR